MAKVGVVGTTSWGTTLAIALSEQGCEVSLWARNETEADTLRTDNENKRLVPGAKFPKTLEVTASPKEAFGDAELVLIAVPSANFRDNVRSVGQAFNDSAVVVTATKGLEADTGKRMSQVLEEELTGEKLTRICALSGPNLAKEIAQGKPSSTVIGSYNGEAATFAQSVMNSPRFRVYTNDDIVGVEFGGALKNIIALGAGICDGFAYGDNAKASFITRGLAEISRLAVAAGGKALTIAGLAGMGDLIATCSSPLSRNRYVGERLAKGESIKDIRSSMINVAEGVDTTAAALRLSKELDVEMPITEGMYGVLFEGLPLQRAISDLLERAPRSET
ncbi:MAG: NAD(P)-dependent glycerol-3-phosphate dehydrogenase [Chloroflexi bacterium]|nr:NAD(P)-dependent glycerol-3-phosphate dehydrogenase [Chloroflexota bacterium]